MAEKIADSYFSRNLHSSKLEYGVKDSGDRLKAG